MSFLEQYRTQSQDFTHTGLQPPLKGKFQIPDEALGEFHACYTDALEGGFPLSLTERHKSFSPVLVDLDLLFNQDTGLQRKVTPGNIESLYKMYMYVIDNMFGDSITTDARNAYVFLKPEPLIHNGNIKDGIHIVFPELIIKTDVQLILRKRVVHMCINSGIFESIGCKNTAEDIIDESVVKRNNWLMYGSSKNPPENVYELVRCIGWENGEIIEKPFSHIEDPVSYFSIRRPVEEIPYTLSADSTFEEPEYRYSNDVSDTFVAQNLIRMLSKQRAENYNTWIEVGFCAHNINCSGLLNTWIVFSQQSSKYQQNECERMWKTFKNDGLTIGSLHRWARIDNEAEYKKFIQEHCKNDLIESLSGTEYDVAKLLHSQYRHEYICANPKSNVWYRFENHRWRMIESAIDLKNILSEDLSLQYMNLGMFYKRRLIETADDVKKKDMENRLKQCEAMKNRVKTTRFKANVIEECKSQFYHHSFSELLDTRTHLLCFENGVYDLNARRFRDGRPDDYVTNSTLIDYVTYDETNQHIIAVYEFLSKVFVDEDLRTYILTVLGSFLHGDKDDQHFHIWTGCGSNGKSTIVDFIDGTFGDYCCPLPVTLLTRPRGSNGSACPELRASKGKRFAHMQEPENGDQLYVGHMKEITGGDAMVVRGLYESPLHMTPQFSLVLCCNDLPPIPATDGGTWRRIRPVRFKSKFVDTVTKGDGYEFKKDSKILKNIKKKEWREAFASILIHMYGVYRDRGVRTPESVLEHSREYQKSSNLYLEFFDECLEDADPTKNKKTLVTHFYEAFKKWHQASFSGKAPSRNQLKDEIEKKWGKMHRTQGWNNVRIIEETHFDG